MAKRIPKELRRRLLIALSRATEPMPSSYYAEVSKALSPSCHRSPVQITMMLKQMKRDVSEITAVDLSKNGTSASGAQRTRKGWYAPSLCLEDDSDILLPDAKPSLKKVSVNLPPDCVEHLESLKNSTGMSPGKVFVDFLRADMAANAAIEDVSGGETPLDQD